MTESNGKRLSEIVMRADGPAFLAVLLSVAGANILNAFKLYVVSATSSDLIFFPSFLGNNRENAVGRMDCNTSVSGSNRSIASNGTSNAENLNIYRPYIHKSILVSDCAAFCIHKII